MNVYEQEGEATIPRMVSLDDYLGTNVADYWRS
jgi:hypothetical protein